MAEILEELSPKKAFFH